MSKKLYATTKELENKCKAYLKSTEFWTPRSFRVYIGLSKHLLSTWKNTNPEYFNLIKHYENIILAKIEEVAVYGATHPMIRNKFTKIQEGKNGNTYETKFNQVGAMFILKAYDNELYNQLPPMDREEQQAPVQITWQNKSNLQLNKFTKEE